MILIHGPRQCGKTTLALMIGREFEYHYFNFDDATTLNAAREDPVGFVDNLPGKTILDEVQRVPEIFPAIKIAVDRDRRPGQFLITGSAEILLVPKLSESLAGRMEIFRLHPFAEAETSAHSEASFLSELFSGRFPTATFPRLKQEIAEIIVQGGFPLARERASPRRRSTWYREYINTLVQRDVRDVANIRSLDVMPRLLAAAASQTAQLFNVAELASPFQLSRPTVRDYVTILERVFLLEQLKPWHSNRLNRLVKTPKLHVTDTGLACVLLDVNAKSLWADRKVLGKVLETFVFQELRRQASWSDAEIQFYFFRDRYKNEVDLVLKRENRIAAIEVKAAASVQKRDFAGIEKLQEAAADRFRVGVVLYDGELCTRFGDAMFAVPIRRLWESR